MKKAQLKHINNRHFRKLKKRLRQVLPAFDIEAIHQFRVEYKKWRAFLRLLADHPALEGPVKVPKSLKKAYGIAGSIRDRQLQQQRILQASSGSSLIPWAYHAMLQNKINELKPGLAGLVNKNTWEPMKARVNPVLPCKFSEKHLIHFARNKRDNIYGLITAGRLTDEIIHDIRKHMKDLFYIMESFTKTTPAYVIITVWKRNKRAFDAVVEEIGNWQDKRAATQLLDPSILQHLDDREKSLLEQLRNDWEQDKQQLQQALLNKLQPGHIPSYLQAAGTDHHFSIPGGA